jgi:flagellar biosynthesis protein FliQ
LRTSASLLISILHRNMHWQIQMQSTLFIPRTVNLVIESHRINLWKHWTHKHLDMSVKLFERIIEVHVSSWSAKKFHRCARLMFHCSPHFVQRGGFIQVPFFRDQKAWTKETWQYNQPYSHTAGTPSGPLFISSSVILPPVLKYVIVIKVSWRLVSKTGGSSIKCWEKNRLPRIH